MGHSEDSEDSADWLMKEVAKAAAEPDEAPLRHPVPGDRVGNARQYEIRQLLGQGGMGTVLLAYDSVLDRRVALKFLRPGTGLSLDALLAQLQGEGQATARADHENIVRIFGKDEWDDGTHRIPFLIMEFLEGESLSSLLKRQRPDLRRALALMEGIAAGLAHAHQAGVIHLDLKPGNVFITRRGQVKLLDFGIARLTQGPGARPLDGFYCPGTKPYMAPEQLRDEALTPAADLWAAGVILFELIAGEHPFADANAFLLVERVLSDEPPPSIRERRPDVPEGVERLLSALLAKAPDRRIQNGGELLEELRELRERLWGRAAATRATGSERRQVTLVSCLLAGRPSEDGGEGAVLDGQSEDFHDLERAFQDLCARAFRRRGGTLYTRVGDEVVAVFGYPRAQEDDTAGASRAALEVAAAVQRELAPRYPGRLAVKIGLEAALVCLAETADGTLAVQGEGPKIAQWIARQAGLDEVVLGPAAQALVRGAFSFQELEGRRVFEGLGGTLTLRLFRLLQERRVLYRFAQTHGPGELTPLVGRARELGMLLDAWEQARLGRGSAIVLTGEPGVGKSRLLQELHARLPRHTSIWAMCQCWSQVENSPYSPVIDLFERMFGIGKADPVARKLEKLDETLATQRLPAEYQPVLASFLSLPVPADAPFLSLSRRQQKERTRELMMALLRRQTETEEVPIGLVFEDLHWADPSTLELLGYVLERIQDMRVLILMSARPEFEPPWRPRPWLRRMFIERLSTAETETLVGEVARGRSLSRTLVEELATRAGGVPLFVEELTRMVLRRTAGGVSPPPAAELPDTLQRLLRARLDRLPRRLGELTQWAAVAGRSFSSTLLAQARGVEEAALRRELSLLVTRGLLEREPSAESIYHFRHPLLHEVAYRSRTRSDTRALHAEFARVLALRHAEGLEAQPELLAYHYTEAGKDALAIHQWAKAADVASQRSAYVEAAGLLRRALSLVRKLPESADRNREELSLLIRLGLVLMECEGCSEDGERVYRRIRELMGALGEDIPRVMEVSPWGAFAFIFARGEFQSAYELTVQLMELGRQTRTPYLLVLGHRAQATVLFTWGRMEAAREHVERALAYSHFDPECQRAVARQALAGKHWVDPLLLARAYATVVYSGIGLARRADELARETERMARLLDHPHSTAAALMYLSLACQVRGEPEGVIHWADQVLAISREHKFLLWLLWASLVKCWAEVRLGRHDRIQAMREHLEQWTREGRRSGMPHNLGMMADMYLCAGQVDEGLEMLRQAFDWLERVGERSYEVELHRLHGELSRRRGDQALARESFERAVSIANEQGASGFGLRAVVSLARQRLELGFAAEARALLERSLARVEPRPDWPDSVAAARLLARLGERGASPFAPWE